MTLRDNQTNVFLDYASGYDAPNPMIQAKIDHSLRVASFSEAIAESLNRADIDPSFAWFLGLVHDIGRFEQVRRYGTFLDRDSVDHAELGADILFRDGLIDSFPADSFPAQWRKISECAIRLHNKLKLPLDLDPLTETYSTILRDADKTDIFRVIAELPFETRIGSSSSLFSDTDTVSKDVMAYVTRHECIPRAILSSRLDAAVSHLCLAFELVYPKTKELVRKQGYLKQLLKSTEKTLSSPAALAQFAIIRIELYPFL
ncbi:MAG: HD domain-containing protein [Solobacterium sp.]|nr:HD domain-containing protein [Solobacterium sp.]